VCDDCTGMAAMRNEVLKTTTYEFSFPAHSLGMDAYASGMAFGLGVCVNDGDFGVGQAGQSGWSGWAPYGIVVGGKQAESCGLAVLTGSFIKAADIADWSPTSTSGAATCDDLRIWEVWSPADVCEGENDGTAVCTGTSTSGAICDTEDDTDDTGDCPAGCDTTVACALNAASTGCAVGGVGSGALCTISPTATDPTTACELTTDQSGCLDLAGGDCVYTAAVAPSCKYTAAGTLLSTTYAKDGGTKPAGAILAAGGNGVWSSAGLGCYANTLDQGAQPEVDDMKWDITPATGQIMLDGDLGDWTGVSYKSQSAFRPCDKGADGTTCASPFVEFDVCTACVADAMWYGITDHAEATAIVWSPVAIYMGTKVWDDTHQDPGGGWNGDSVQIMFTNAARSPLGTAKTGEIQSDGGMILYNYGFSGTTTYTEHESHPCSADCTSFAAQRFEDIKVTIYEFFFPAHSFGMDSFVSGFAFGLGTCINDGDIATGQGGQGGWSGWAPYGIVHGGKQAQNNGLAQLVGTFGTSAIPATCTGADDGTATDAIAATCTGTNDGSGGQCVLVGDPAGNSWCAVAGGDCVLTDAVDAVVNACILNADSSGCAVAGGDCVFTTMVSFALPSSDLADWMPSVNSAAGTSCATNDGAAASCSTGCTLDVAGTGCTADAVTVPVTVCTFSAAVSGTFKDFVPPRQRLHRQRHLGLDH
jgi:hypothetical protein